MGVLIKFPRELTPHQREIVRSSIDKGVRDAWQQGMDIDHTVFDVHYVPSRRDNPDFLIGIHVEGPHIIKVGVQPERMDKDTELFRSTLHRLTTHELNHIECIDNNGIRVVTLADALISEGLAQTAELVAGHQPAPWTRFHSKADAERYTHAALKHLDRMLDCGGAQAETKYDQYSYWFFGVDHLNPYTKKFDPGFGGYPLSQAIIWRYALDRQQDMAEMTGMPTDTIISHWKSDIERHGIPGWVERSLEPVTHLCPFRQQRKAVPPTLVFSVG